MRWSAGPPDEALALYDARVWGDGSSENLSLCNDISMLARLEIAGVDVGARWDAAAKVVRDQAGGSVLAFVDAHYALALGAVPPLEERGTHRRACTTRSAAPPATRPSPGARKDHARVVERLAPVRKELRRIGGSHAQRDLFTLILLDSAMKTGNRALANTLRAERAALRPHGVLPRQLTAIKE